MARHYPYYYGFIHFHTACGPNEMCMKQIIKYNGPDIMNNESVIYGSACLRNTAATVPEAAITTVGIKSPILYVYIGTVKKKNKLKMGARAFAKIHTKLEIQNGHA